jgi:Cell wall-active antibiotics response 4TMS YvqF
MSDVPQPPPAPAEPPSAPSATRLVAGVLLVLLGVGWLLEVLDVVDVPWDLLLPVALVLVGLALLSTARLERGHGGLIVTGVVLSVLLLVGSSIDVPFGGGVGDRLYRPATPADLRGDYQLGLGQLTVDLGNLPTLEGVDVEHVRVRLGMGKLIVIVPDTLPVLVEARAGLGNVQVFDVEGSGVDVERVVGPPSISRGDPLDLVLSVGIGQVEVRRA